ncbi:MAG: BamA/TamA family outer membrane protein [Cyanobacteria bacterium J06623_7]
MRFVDAEGNLVRGKTKPIIITQEFALEPGDVYDADLAKSSLSRVLDLLIVDRASLSLEAMESGQTIMLIAVEENSNLAIGFGLTLPAPTALQGSVRPVTVPALSDSPTGFGVGVRVGLLNLGGLNQGVSLGVEGGEDTFGFNLGYRRFLRSDRGLGINLFNRRGVEAEFDGGDPDINLSNDIDPVVHRFGGGIEYFFPIADVWQGAIGTSYQKVSIRDGVFSDNLQSTDALGNRLTVSDSGQDEFLTLNFATVLNREDNPRNPTAGYKLLLGSDLYLPLGDGDILAHRLAANYTHYLPVPLFGFTRGAKTLVLNVQGGTILGDGIPYESFLLGGSSSVRGYSTSEISTARSFIQGTAEYRYPIVNLTALNNQIEVGGTFFVDYASDLGSADAVIGRPGVVRDRTGSGWGYGLGLRTLTPVGAVRTEFALNDAGDREFIFTIGDRF